jgi:hypothetical protein
MPGDSTNISTDILMHGDMGGKHLFEIDVTTNDRDHPLEKLLIASNWVP